MDNFTLTRLIIVISVIVLIVSFSLSKLINKRNVFTSRFIAKTAVFASISIVLYIVPVFNIALPIFPSFLKIHFDEIPALIAGMAYGPISGIIVILIKTIVKLPMSSTLCVGELADLIYSLAFVLPASLIYKKMRTIKGAFISLSIATLIQLLVSCFVTSFLILDFYIFVMGWSKEMIINACKAVNPNVTSLGFTFLLFIALPFNALKDVLVVIATFLLYKRLHKLIDKIGAQKN